MDLRKTKEIINEKHFNEMGKSTKQSMEFSNKTLDIILDTIDEGDEPEKIANKYEIHEKLGEGSFGVVYKVLDAQGMEYAAKLESVDDIKKHLYREHLIYNTLKNNRNFPKKYFYGYYGDYRVMVMEKLGDSLKVKMKGFHHFDINTVANIAVQILYRLQDLHNKGWLHQDIKPENILVDNFKQQKLYLIDYGTSGSWWNNETLQHVECKSSRKIIGTARYSCIANHQGLVQSRKDDLESFGYVLLYFALGRLPWQGIRANNFREKWGRIKKIKLKIDIYELCNKNNLNDSFILYFKYLEKLKFEQVPDYSYLRIIFRKYIKSDFFWCKN